jgi:hypothetical protein
MGENKNLFGSEKASVIHSGLQFLDQLQEVMQLRIPQITYY